MPYRARLPCAGDPRGSGWRAVRWRAWIEACTAPFGWSTRPPTTRPRLCGSRHTLQRVRDDLDRYSDPETAQNRPFWWVFGGDLTGSAPPREPPDRVIQPSDSYHESDWNHRPGVWPPIRENATATTCDAQRFVTLRDRIGPRPRPMGGFQLPPPSPQMPACRGGQPTGPGNTPAGATRERPGRTRRSASETSSPTTTWSSARAADLQRGRSVTAGRRSPGRRPAAGAGDPPGMPDQATGPYPPMTAAGAQAVEIRCPGAGPTASTRAAGRVAGDCGDALCGQVGTNGSHYPPARAPRFAAAVRRHAGPCGWGGRRGVRHRRDRDR